MANLFKTGVIRDTHGSHVIGYKVTSQATGAGTRVHFTLKGGDWAKDACERYAAALQAEADAAGTARNPEASRNAARVYNEIEALRVARAAENKARKAAKPHYRALG